MGLLELCNKRNTLLAEEVSEKCFKNILHFNVWNSFALSIRSNNAHFLLIYAVGKEKKTRALASLRVHLYQYLTWFSQ